MARGVRPYEALAMAIVKQAIVDIMVGLESTYNRHGRAVLNKNNWIHIRRDHSKDYYIFIEPLTEKRTVYKASENSVEWNLADAVFYLYSKEPQYFADLDPEAVMSSCISKYLNHDTRVSDIYIGSPLDTLIVYRPAGRKKNNSKQFFC